MGAIRTDATGTGFVTKNLAQFEAIKVGNGGARLEFNRATGLAGTAVMRPDLGYVVTRVETARLPKPSNWADEFVRDIDPVAKRPGSDLPLVRSITYSADDEQTGKPLTRLRIDFSDFSAESPPDEIFRLSHYGLPEPVGTKSPKTMSPFLWLLLAAAVCAVLALGLWYFGRRRGRRA